MSLATRCSHCSTTFRVQQDQLAASEGWVRCGKCREVFNAIEGMFEVKAGAGSAVGGLVEHRHAADSELATDIRPSPNEADAQTPASGDDAHAMPQGGDLTADDVTADDVAADDTRDDDTSGGDSDAAVVEPSSADRTAAAEAAVDAGQTDDEPAHEPAHKAANDAPAVDDAAIVDSATADVEKSEEATPRATAEESTAREAAAEHVNGDAPTIAAGPAPLDRDAIDGDVAAAEPDAARTDADLASDDESSAIASAASQPGTEDDARDLEAARVSLFGPDSIFEDEHRTRRGPDSGRMSLWPSSQSERPRRKTRRSRPKAVAHRDDRDFELSETTLDVMAMPTAEAVDQLLTSNVRDTTFVDYEPMAGYEVRTRPHRRRHPQWRMALRVAAILLGVTLALQGLLHSRDSIAARWPGTETALQRLCAPFGCTVDAPRRIEALRVQSVTFNEMSQTNLYRLSVVLTNQTDTRVKMPALDLRISDARGETLARRVLTAGELGTQATWIAPQSEATLQAVLHIDQANVSGYDVTVFYP